MTLYIPDNHKHGSKYKGVMYFINMNVINMNDTYVKKNRSEVAFMRIMQLGVYTA